MQQVIVQECGIAISQIPTIAQTVKIPVQIRARIFQNVIVLFHAVSVNGHGQRKMRQITGRIRRHEPAESLARRAIDMARHNICVRTVKGHLKISIKLPIILRTDTGIHTLRTVGPMQRRQSIITNKFITTIRLEHGIIIVGPYAALKAVYIVFKPKARNIQVQVRMSVTCRRALEHVDVVVFVGVIFHANFIVETRENRPLEIQHTTGVIHQIITAPREAHPIQPHRFGLRHHRDKATVTIKRIAQLLTTYTVKRSRKMLDFIRTDNAANLCVTATEITTYAAHGTEGRSRHSCETHRRVHPSQVAQMQKVMRGFHSKINLVHLTQSRRRLVSGTAPHVRKQGVNVHAIREAPHNRKAEFLIHLGTTIADGNLHRLVAVSFKGIFSNRSIRILIKGIPSGQNGRIPHRQGINIHAESAYRKQ